MDIDHMKKCTFNMENNKGELVVKGEIIGETEISFFDDLKLKAVIALLNSIDHQNFIDSGNDQLFDHYIREIEEMINEVKKHKQFQGKTKLM
ncbi:hypothetical protein JMM81_07910 [Bacillus sp. V3B]|uniref:hypothetical protein n=1 Tax=Bacillus sp. V3B TaxID=2804915 RepID=UPI00210A3B28|nr:hypothetical protein [Bacillus sp. V3B]MCQ6274888.1 hypothetical protein [Bacillus sp. V3B]